MTFSITALVESVVVALGSLSFQFGANVRLVFIQRVKLADVLGEIVVKRRQLGLGDAVDLYMEDLAFLPASSLA